MNKITVPVFELQNDGTIKPNYLFHRPLDKVHSRCIEYPYAASKWRRSDRRLLDVGITGASPLWIKWLESLPSEVHATDYDDVGHHIFSNIEFHQADVRDLPYKDDFFDLIFAVSVIEHIGLENPQVLNKVKPQVEEQGDIQAVKELARVLHAGGQLVMTLPFGLKDELIMGNQARCYNRECIKKFEGILQIDKLSCYEYQPSFFADTWKSKLFRKAWYILSGLPKLPVDVPGRAVWREIPIEQARAKNKWHVDGVVCGVWGKM